MKFTDFQRKAVSLIVLATFVALLHFWAAPVSAATNAGNSETKIARGDSGGPIFMEQESNSGTVIKKQKKFPWLIVGLGAVAVGIALLLLVKKGSNSPSNDPKFIDIEKEGDIVGSYSYCGGVPCGYTRIFHVENIGASGEINVTVTAGS